ncbi:MAG TPA: hypothetical protein VN081_04625 [Dongiaceae bacterium]|nr:hypothetical protein [Dongiaceae bacterium]
MADINHDKENGASSAKPSMPNHNKGTVIGISIAIGIAVLIVGVGAGFMAGLVATHFGARPRLGVQTPFTGGMGAMGGRGVYGAGLGHMTNGVRGTVTAISSTSLSVKTASGAIVTYAITSNTTVTNTGSAAAVSDIKVGDTVRVVQAGDTTGDAKSVEIL